ncbi:MAG: hypothetical protein EOO56_00835 [Hymenobacter sp.]|nr:MAG: hypothetical protein EOO56_00835 [Hymenobacter sp.]
MKHLLRRIAKEVTSPEEIELYFTSAEEGHSKLTTLELNEYGNISGGLFWRHTSPPPRCHWLPAANQLLGQPVL